VFVAFARSICAASWSVILCSVVMSCSFSFGRTTQGRRQCAVIFDMATPSSHTSAGTKVRDQENAACELSSRILDRARWRDDCERSGHAKASVSTASINRETQLIAGISVADSLLVKEALEYAQRLSEPFLFNHAMRSWLFAEAIGRSKGIEYDHEV